MSNSHPKLIKHVHAHEVVITNVYWYGDGPPLMHPSLSAAKTADRKADVVDLLENAANKSKDTGDRGQSRLLRRLANKIDRCRRRDRCGSLACPECARAFQRAKADAQKEVFLASAPKPAGSNSDPANRILVMATVIPLHLRYSPAALAHLDIAKRTRWFKDVLTNAGLAQMMVGSADISWEHRRKKHYYQLHWHLAMWTKDPEKLQKRLLRLFPPKNKYDRPVEVTKSRSLNFLPYMNKAIHRPRVFCASLADVFDNQAAREWRRDLFVLIRECRRLDWLLLTKRPGRWISQRVAWHDRRGPGALQSTMAIPSEHTVGD
jgi:hypothetical protein